MREGKERREGGDGHLYFLNVAGPLLPTPPLPAAVKLRNYDILEILMLNILHIINIR